MSCQQRAWKNVVERGSGRLARASSTASGNVRTALWRCEAPKNRVSARSRRAHVVAASMTRASSARKCQVEKSNTRQKKPFCGDSGNVPVDDRSRGTTNAPHSHQVDSDATRGSNTGSRRLARVVLLLGRGSGVQIHGRRVFAFGAFEVLLNPRSTNENDEPNEQKCQVGPELVWRGSFIQESRVCAHELYETSLIFFFVRRSKKISRRNASSSAASVGG